MVYTIMLLLLWLHQQMVTTLTSYNTSGCDETQTLKVCSEITMHIAFFHNMID